MHPEVSENLSLDKDQKTLDTERVAFRRDVQYKVMQKMGYKLTLQNSNEVFYKWISDGMAQKFAKCYQDIVPDGSDRSREDIVSVADLVAIEMSKELKH